LNQSYLVYTRTEPRVDTEPAPEDQVTQVVFQDLKAFNAIHEHQLMQAEPISKLDDYYTRRKLEEMIRINSVVGQEAEIAEYLQRELEALGLRCEIAPVEPNRPNVYAKLESNRPGRRFMFNGHTDTVPVSEGWTTNPFEPVEKEGRLYGLGSCDMKAGFACALNAIRAITESKLDLPGTLLFSAVIDEEAYSKGAKAMLTTEYAKCDAILLCEPYSGESTTPIPLGITGKILYDITVKGRAAHGFSPQLGINAIEEAAKILTNLDRIKMRDHPRFHKGNYCTLKIEGGYKTYSVVVPERCRFEINRLLVPGETPDTAVDDLNDLVRSLDLKAEVEVGIKPPRYEPFEISPDEPVIKIFHEVYRETMGVEPQYAYETGITDANVFAGEAGIPCLHLGPKRGGEHQPNEHVPLDWLPPISRMYALIAARFLSSEEPRAHAD
jgi:acetylornithine deacetylase/succinyl-diaminopimelate desuccinylase family protein